MQQVPGLGQGGVHLFPGQNRTGQRFLRVRQRRLGQVPDQQFAAKPGIPEAGSGTVQRVSLAEGVGEDSPDAVGSAGFGTEPLDLGQQGHQLLLELQGQTVGGGGGLTGLLLRLPCGGSQLQIGGGLPLQRCPLGPDRLLTGGDAAAGYHII